MLSYFADYELGPKRVCQCTGANRWDNSEQISFMYFTFSPQIKLKAQFGLKTQFRIRFNQFNQNPSEFLYQII